MYKRFGSFLISNCSRPSGGIKILTGPLWGQSARVARERVPRGTDVQLNNKYENFQSMTV